MRRTVNRHDPSEVGKMHERRVLDGLISRGFVLIEDERLRKEFRSGLLSFGSEALGHKWVMRNLKKYRNIYDVEFFSDFVVYDVASFPRGLVIEVKNQSTAGSVDEKYVFTVESLKALYKQYDGLASWLLFSGMGARPCAVKWMRGQTRWNDTRQEFRFLNIEEWHTALLDL